MNHKGKPWRRWLAVFFGGCILLGSSLAYATSLFWSYPNDHILITEVNYQGAPGAGPGTQWIELYNPTDNDVYFLDLYVDQSDGGLTGIPTPTPSAPGLGPTPYPFAAGCFLYLARDATEFYDQHNQCPDYAASLDGSICPDTERLWWPSVYQIDEVNDTLCVRLRLVSLGEPPDPYLFTDAVGWGTGGAGIRCGPVDHPLPAPASTPGVTYLRGSDDPWIGPGAEGEELPDQPLTEELAAVWNLSSEVNVPWAGPEAGACRVPTAVTLQHTQAHTAQNSGLILAFFGFIGLLILAVLWKPQPTEA